MTLKNEPHGFCFIKYQNHEESEENGNGSGWNTKNSIFRKKNKTEY
jgi:hypothetical protein